MIEQDRSHSLVIAATNHPRILDPALFRRFDDILHYELPDGSQIAQLLRTRLASEAVKRIRWRSLADLAAGLSYAEVVRAADEVLKDALIHERPLVREADVRVMLKERRAIADKLAARQNVEAGGHMANGTDRRSRSARRVQVPGGVQGRQPGDRRAVLALRKPQPRARSSSTTSGRGSDRIDGDWDAEF